jgi:ATP-binding cassette subfamily F protein 3
MCPSDLLLLDEPTNHLDLDAVLWLEQWLRSYPGTLLLISHDRDFLDNVVDRVANMENNTITLYRGGYSEFERQQAERLAQQQALHERQQREVAHMRAFVDRFRAKATKARQAQSRLKALERMELIEAAHVDSPFRFAFRKPGRLPNPLLVLDRAAAGYAGRPVIDNVRLTLLPGQRLGLLGHNGAGKSTLIKLLAGGIPTLGGERTESDGLRIGYFAQHQLEQLDPEASALLHLQRLDGRATEQELRNFLGGFAFQSDRVLEPCGHFSGGEKARLVLALLVWQSPNLLLLDEPTNHLDLEMRDALNRALQDYTGAVVLVSHDRHLLRTTTDDLYLVADGAVRPFEGDLDDYRDWLAREAGGAAEESGAPTGDHTATARKAQRRAAAEQRARLQPLTRELQKLEREMERRQAEQAQIEAALVDPTLYDAGRKEELKQWLQRQAETATRLEQTEHHWLETSERIEALRAELEGC